MSHSSALFNRVPVDLPNRSGFNLDHENGFTATCGTLTPCLVHPLLPNDTISLGTNFQVQLPPMVTDFYGKVDAVIEAFFVPYRILWAGWESFITHPTKNPRYPEGTPYQLKPASMPTILSASMTQGNAGVASLSDYLGFKVASDTIAPSAGVGISAMPWLAYHMIYDKWYRDSRIQAPLFYAPQVGSTAGATPATAPYCSVVSNSNLDGPSYAIAATLADGVGLGSLRQRNWSKGYFTTASPYPQAGGDSEITIDVVDNTGAISIASIRSANSLQKWMERNNFSYEYGDQIYGQYGIFPDAAKMDKPIYLGRVKQTVYSRSVFQTADAAADSTINDVVGAKKASSQAIGEGRLIDKFTASEHGLLMCIFSLVPHGYYSTGCARYLFETEMEDIPFPLLAGMGDQPIYVAELNAALSDNYQDNIFGYTDLYAHYKYMEDEVHGLLRDGSNLAQYQLQRSFDSSDVELGTDFLQIPINAMDQVQAVNTSEQGFSCWADTFFKFTKVSTLPAYSLPTLGDLKNTHKGNMSRGGSRL